MYDTRPYEQHPDQFHQCFEHLDHQTRCPETAIVGEYFCVHHRIQPSPIYIRPDGSFHLNPLTDRDSIVRAASEIAYRVASKSLDEKRAGKLLYACQIANQALEGKLRDQKLALQQAKQAAAAESTPPPSITSHPPSMTRHPPSTPCHSEAQPKNPGSSHATEPRTVPANPEPHDGEPEPQDLGISPATEPDAPPTTPEPVILSEAVRFANSAVEGPASKPVPPPPPEPFSPEALPTPALTTFTMHASVCRCRHAPRSRRRSQPHLPSPG